MTDCILDLYPTLVDIRRHIHQHPEVSFSEFETTAFIESKLKPLGFELQKPLETGIIAVVNPECTSNRVIAFRADIDALPIQEEGSFKQAFISKNPGVAHCCGHDMHTANLLGLALLLNDKKSELKHKIVLIFQPAEEKLPGGGKLITDSGILDDLGVT